MGIGDEIMCLGRLERLYEETGKPHSVVCATGIKRDHPAWHGNPAYDKNSPKSIKDGGGYRPYIRGWQGSRIIFEENHRPRAGKIFLTESEKSSFSEITDRFKDGFVVIAPHLKDAASPNKSWGFDNFQEVAAEIRLPIIQLIEDSQQKIIENSMPLNTKTFREAAGVISRARLVICNEGGTHHMAASMGVPAVVVLGSFIPPEITGYDAHANVTVSGATYCGDWSPCQDCRKAMEKIKPRDIMGIAERFLGGENAAGVYRI